MLYFPESIPLKATVLLEIVQSKGALTDTARYNILRVIFPFADYHDALHAWDRIALEITAAQESDVHGGIRQLVAVHTKAAVDAAVELCDQDRRGRAAQADQALSS